MPPKGKGKGKGKGKTKDGGRALSPSKNQAKLAAKVDHLTTLVETLTKGQGAPSGAPTPATSPPTAAPNAQPPTGPNSTAEEERQVIWKKVKGLEAALIQAKEFGTKSTQDAVEVDLQTARAAMEARQKPNQSAPSLGRQSQKSRS